MTFIDRERLHERFASEQQCFVATHPRSAELPRQARAHLLTGVPMAWMTRWPGSFPVFSAEAHGAHVTHVDGVGYVDFALGDAGAMTGHSQARRAGLSGSRSDNLLCPCDHPPGRAKAKSTAIPARSRCR